MSYTVIECPQCKGAGEGCMRCFGLGKLSICDDCGKRLVLCNCPIDGS